jgi:hypothetical protein
VLFFQAVGLFGAVNCPYVLPGHGQDAQKMPDVVLLFQMLVELSGAVVLLFELEF